MPIFSKRRVIHSSGRTPATPVQQIRPAAVVARAAEALADFGLGLGLVIASASQVPSSPQQSRPPAQVVRAAETPQEYGLGGGSVTSSSSIGPPPPPQTIVGGYQAEYVVRQGRPITSSGLAYYAPPAPAPLVPLRTAQIVAGESAPVHEGTVHRYTQTLTPATPRASTPRRAVLVDPVNAPPHPGAVLTWLRNAPVTVLIPPLLRPVLVREPDRYEHGGAVTWSASRAPKPAGNPALPRAAMVGNPDPALPLFSHWPVLTQPTWVPSPASLRRAAMWSGGFQTEDVPMITITPGAVSQSLPFFLRDITTGKGKTGLAYNTAGAVASYTRAGGSPTAITLASLSGPTAAYTSGGFVQEDATLAAGAYRLDSPNAALAAGVPWVYFVLSFPNAIDEGLLVLLQTQVSNLGAGAIAWTITVTASGQPLEDAEVWVSTDSAGTNVVAGVINTNSLGQAAFMLDAGSYYLWVVHVSYTGTNPTAFVVS